jgi:glucose-6-phosphate dehydrogenase assembly protein OpcA
VYLVWLGTVQPYPKLLLESEDQVDRIMIDSRICQKPMDFYKDLRDHGHWDSMAYTDLAWGRIAPLLRATALLFNPYDLREKLQAVTEIHFTGGQIAEALLFFLWFSSKMGYKLITSGASQWEFAREDEKLVAKHSGAQDLEEGFGITFMTSAGETFAIESKEEGYIVQTAPGQDRYSSIIKLPKDSDILLSEVDRTGQDRLYSGSIHKI